MGGMEWGEAAIVDTNRGEPGTSVSRLGGPLKVGLVFAALGILLAIIGVFRGMVPLNGLSIFLALLISGGSWGIVSWAVATAAVDVDRDLEEAASAEVDVTEQD